MNKKAPVLRFPNPKTVAQSDDQSWHNGGDIENPRTSWEVCPIILLYRRAVELHLKLLVGEGGNFLPSPTDSLTLYKTHSLRWLAQIVCQIIRAVEWESDFKCECVSSLVDFSALVSELEALDPVSCAIHSAKRDRRGGVPSQLQRSNIVDLLPKLDALLDLLGATADALAAEWDLRADE